MIYLVLQLTAFLGVAILGVAGIAWLWVAYDERKQYNNEEAK